LTDLSGRSSVRRRDHSETSCAEIQLGLRIRHVSAGRTTGARLPDLILRRQGLPRAFSAEQTDGLQLFASAIRQPRLQPSRRRQAKSGNAPEIPLFSRAAKQLTSTGQFASSPQRISLSATAALLCARRETQRRGLVAWAQFHSHSSTSLPLVIRFSKARVRSREHRQCHGGGREIGAAPITVGLWFRGPSRVVRQRVGSQKEHRLDKRRIDRPSLRALRLPHLDQHTEPGARVDLPTRDGPQLNREAVPFNRIDMRCARAKRSRH
jgi:hypothetical protein